jgi:hypothetical protein
MNNVKKNFQTKSMLRCMADGGLVRNNEDFNGPQRAVDAMAEGRDPNEDRRAKAAEYGMAPKKKAEPNMFEKAKAAADAVRAKLGFADGGEVEGEGGPTDDQIHAMLSDGEFVLPADTVKHIGPEVLEELVERTHKPTGKSNLRHMADGGFVYPNADGLDTKYGANALRRPPMAPYPSAEGLSVREGAGALRPPVMQPAPTPGPYPSAEGLTVREGAGALRNPNAPTQFGASASDRFAQQSMQEAQAASRAASRAAYAAPEAAVAEAASPAARVVAQGSQAASKVGGVLSRGASALRALPGNALRTATGTLGKAGLAGAAIASTPTIMGTDTEDYRKRFGMGDHQMLGQLGAGGQVADDLLIRTLGAGSDVANAMTFGALGHTFADKQGMQDPTMAGAHPLAAPAAAPQAASGVRTYNPEPGRTAVLPDGIAVANTRDGNHAFANATNVRPQDGVAEDPIQGALRQLLHQQGGGVGMINSRSGSINNQFDALQKQITDTYGGKAQGTMISKLLDLQKARADALGQDQGALVNSQGNVVNADNSVRSQQASALGDMAGMRNTDKTVGGSLLREQLQGIREADQAQRAGAKANVDALTADALARHTDPTTGKPDVAAAQAEVDSMLQNAPGLVDGSLSPGDSRRATGEYAGERALRDVANQGSGKANDELLNFAPGSALRHPTFGEVTDPNSDVTAGDYAYDKLVDWLPGMQEGVLAQSSDGRVVRNRKLDENQRRALLRKLNQEK